MPVKPKERKLQQLDKTSTHLQNHYKACANGTNASKSRVHMHWFGSIRDLSIQTTCYSGSPKYQYSPISIGQEQSRKSVTSLSKSLKYTENNQNGVCKVQQHNTVVDLREIEV